MTTKQEALEALRKVRYSLNPEDVSPNSERISVIRDFINSVPEWEAMWDAPMDGRHVLLCMKDGTVHIAWFEGSHWDNDTRSNISNSECLGWMPLPQPPKETQ